MSFSLLAATIPRPAIAQWGGNLTLSSEARLRGRPVSRHRPVAELQLVHDDASGFYLGGSAALVATRDEGLQPLSFTQYAGFARRISPSTALDLGVVHGGYTDYSGIAGGGSYTEAYVGLTGRYLSSRLFISPGYFRRHEPTLYGEVNGHLDLSRHWALFAHAGRLFYLRDGGDLKRRDASDWRVGVRRQIGRVDLEVAWTGHVESQRPYGAARRDGSAVVAGLSFAF